MFSKKNEKKQADRKETEKTTDFYESMIDDMLSDAGELLNADGDKKEDVTDDPALFDDLFEDAPASDEEPANDAAANAEEAPLTNEKLDQPSGEEPSPHIGTNNEPTDHHEVDIHKWKSETITSISEEYSEERINSNEIDDELLIALGYVNGDRKDEPERDTLLPEKLFAMTKEFSDVREADTIYERFIASKRKIEFRLIATLLAAILLCLYPYVGSLLGRTVEFFDCERFFVPNMLICLQLLFVAAAFSASDLFFGFIKIFTGKPQIYSASALLFLATTATTVIYAFVSEPTGIVSCSVFMVVSAASMLVPIFCDLMRVKQQMDSFELSADKEDVKSSRIDRCEGEYILAHRGIPKDFAERTKASYDSPKIMNLILLPSFMFSALLGTIVFLTTKNPETALISASATSCIVFPTSQLLMSLPFYRYAHSVLNSENCAIVGRNSVNELSKIIEISVSEGEIFKYNTINPINMQLFGETLYTTIYCTASLTRSRRSPISALFAENIENSDLSGNVQTVEDTRDGIAAIVDNRYAVLCGNARFMRDHDFDVPEPSPEETASMGTTLVYTAINGKIAASICVDYVVREEFYDVLHSATENGIKLKIYSSDFGVTRSVISAKLGIHDDAYELVKEKMPLPTGVSPAVTSDNPAMLFETPVIARAIKKAERLLGIYSGIVSAVSLLPAIAVAVLGLTVSPYIILIYHAITALPVFIISKLYLQSKNN